MAKRKRALGGGRKPQGEFDQLTSPFSLRMPEDLRKQLDAAAKKNGRSASQELLSRLHYSFERDRNKDRDAGTRALCFLLAEIIDRIRWAAGPYEWHTSPFLYDAVKTGFIRVLNAIEPKIELVAPAVIAAAQDLKKRAKGTPIEKHAAQAAKEMAASWKSPRNVGTKAANETLAALYYGVQPEIERWSLLLDANDNRIRDLAAYAKTRSERTDYGMDDVRRHLHIADKTEKKRS